MSTPKLIVNNGDDQPLQLALFTISDDQHPKDGRLTHSIALWDTAPRFQVYTNAADREAGKYLKTIERHFMFGPKLYRLRLTPARIERNGVEVEQYPGEREQLVEEVIYQLATTRGRLSFDGKDDKDQEGTVTMTFSLYELREELKRTEHTFDLYEIKEALFILQAANVEISRVDSDPTDGAETRDRVRTAAFPVVKLRERANGQDRAIVHLNPLVADALKKLNFRLMNYELLMRLRGFMPRWLYKRLHANVLYFGNDSAVQIIRASEILRDSGVPERKRKRDTLKRITEAVMSLKVAGVIDDFKTEDIYVGQAKDDIIFTIYLSDSFALETGQARRKSLEKRLAYRDVMGEDAKSFQKTKTEHHLRLVRIQERQAAEDRAASPPSPLLES